ncbi:MAG: formate--tetrahydrofolate ligase [Chitinophagales bacterium]
MNDIDIAKNIKLKPIVEIAKQLGLKEDDLELYGKYKAKLPLHFSKSKNLDQKKLILVSAISPTPAGEGKTTVAIGLNDGLNLIGKKSIAVFKRT